MDVAGLAATRRAEAEAADQRRLLVLAGDRDAGLAAAREAVGAVDLDAVTTVSTRECVPGERVAPARADRLLGTTRDVVVLDAHERFSPNVLGRVAGAVDGGGLLVFLTPPLGEWPSRRGEFDERLAVEPFGVGDVGTRFRRRLVTTLRDHPGVAVVDVDAGSVERDGRLAAEPRRRDRPTVPPGAAFPRAAYEACLTSDQVRALRGLEDLDGTDAAVVVEADRGRGKSAAAGLAAGALAADGRDILVTAPRFDAAAELFTRARRLLETIDALDTGGERRLTTHAGGAVRFEQPAAAADLPGAPDAVVADEAAALPVDLLDRLLAAPAAAFVTTVHGYEGAGRGFAVRFRDRLAASSAAVGEVHLEEPIRYARDDPVESWVFRALLLDAGPAVDAAVEDARPATATYRSLGADALADDEVLLRETFGLLVFAHYRTDPNDLARLLDAPNLSVRALCRGGHVVSVALLAREGGLSRPTRQKMYEGARVRGHMLPDVLTSQLRDERAGVPAGLRVVRIATHHAARSRGLGSRLLAEIRDEFAPQVDWLGAAFGATPDLVRFWRQTGYRTVHLSTTRNDASGEYSVLVLDPTSDDGRALYRRHADRFRDRVGAVLADPLADADPDVVRATLRATDAALDPSLSPHEWRVVAAAAHGPGLYAAAPGAFGRLALAHLLGGAVGAGGGAELPPRAERLLVRKALQGAPWDAVADELGYVSTSECMRALGDACRPLVEAYGDEAAREERDRHRDAGE